MKIYEKLRATFRDFREKTKKLLCMLWLLTELSVTFKISFYIYIVEACLTAITERGFFPDDEINYYPSIKKMRDAMSFMDRARKRNFCKILSKYESWHLAYNQPTILTDSFVSLLASLATAIVLCIKCCTKLHVTVSTIS